MIRQTVRELTPFVDRVVRQRAVVLLLSAGVAGVLEAAALLLTVGVAVSVATTTNGSIDLPLVGMESSPGWVLVAAGICAALSLIVHSLNAFLSADISSRILDRTRRKATTSYINAGWPTQALQREGALQETVTTLALRTSSLVDSLMSGSIYLINLAVFLGASFVVDPAATGVIVVIGAVVVAVMRPIGRVTRRRARLYVEANIGFAEDVSRFASTSMELRVFGVQRVAERELASTSGKVRRRQRRARFAMLLAVGLYKDLAVLLLIACIGGVLVVGGAQIQGLAAVIALMVRALSFAQGANRNYQALNEGISNVIALNDRIGRLDAGVAEGGRRSIDRISSIDFANVTYRYTDDVEALADLTLTLPAGEALGVLGPSGGGKSTFVQVLLRLRPPTSGTVIVDGSDYLEFSESAWAGRIALVPQEPTLIEGSISDNIRYYRDIDQDSIERAAFDANVLDEIMRLPDGFATVLGPRGSGLSGGQKQRVAIARALVGRPQLLVLDEPSSALDVHSERRLQMTLERLKGAVTMVIVAHRMKTVEACDRLLVLENGRMVQLGSPDELLGSEGFYRGVVEALQ